MKQILLFLLSVISLTASAQLLPLKTSRPLQASAVNSDEPEFIFDPVGEEKLYVMTMYSYDYMNSKIVRGTSLKSQVRYDADGKTVYFKDLTKSMGIETWLKGEIDGDTIRIPYGQPLAYYKDRYLVFFVPMLYDDNTGNMEPQDEYKLLVRGDSLISVKYEKEGLFQASCGYVFIGNRQGALSMDIDLDMRLLEIPITQKPAIAYTRDYVHSYTTGHGNLFKRKVKVMKVGKDLYMQLSTSAPNAYIKGTIEDDGTISMKCPQAITDGNYIFYYSLADPIRNEANGEIVDFTPSTTGKGLSWNAETSEITSGKDVISVDFMDGMELCMDYVFQPMMKPYGGNVPAKPIAPRLAKIDIESDFMKYLSFYAPALDVDSNYINIDSITYRIYINDELLVFKPGEYVNIKTETTEIPYNFADGYDFFVYGEQHYVYLYGDIKSVGVEVVYTVNGEKYCSERVTYSKEETTQPEPEDTAKDNDLALKACRVKERMVKPEEKVELTGKVQNLGKNKATGYRLVYEYDGKRTEKDVDIEMPSGSEDVFSITLDHGVTDAANNMPVKLSVEIIGITDQNTSNNDTTLLFSVYEKEYCKGKVLLEEFTSESCGWCPYGAYRIKTALSEGSLGDDVIWVCHHEGYGVDWLTIPESTTYCDLYGYSTFAPAWVIDRNVNHSDLDYPVFSISGKEEIASILGKATKKPCFVNVKVESSCVNDEALITVQVEGSKSFAGQSQNPCLTVFIVEDSIAPKKQRCYDSHTLDSHHNALRAVLTDVWGDSLKLAEQAEGTLCSTTPLSFRYTIPESQEKRNLKVVAFVHDSSSDINSRQVFNATIIPLSTTPDGISTLTLPRQHSHHTKSILNGRLVIQSNGKKFTAAGQVVIEN